MNQLTPLERHLARGPRTAAELCSALDISQPTLSRAIARAPRVLPMGRARATRYGLVEALIDLPPQVHEVYRVTPQAQLQRIGRIAPIAGAGFWYEDDEVPEASAMYDSLPWFLQDLRPQGFLGRATVRDCAARGWPSRLSAWSDRHVLGALVLSNSHDHTGNLLIGERSVTAFRAAARQPIRPSLPHAWTERQHYYRRAVAAIDEGAGGGTSVNGEQPKFCAEISQRHGPARAVIVKFSAPITTEAGQRWSDLLRMEAIALDVVREQLQIPASRAAWHSCGERAYLEVERFDRLPGAGRRGVISMASLDAEFVGAGGSWTTVASMLGADGRLDASSMHAAGVLECFADLIGNDDRHLGNASVHYDGHLPMRLTPVYDMLPMWYAPRATGMNSRPLGGLDQLLDRHLSLAPGDAQRAVAAAAAFWQRCASDHVISQSMRAIADSNALSVAQLHRMQHGAAQQRTSVLDEPAMR